MPLFSLRFSVGDCNSNGDNMNRYMDGGTDRFIETDKLFRTECSMRIYKNNTRNKGKPQKKLFFSVPTTKTLPPPPSTKTEIQYFKFSIRQQLTLMYIF